MKNIFATFTLIFLAASLSACSQSNNVLLGRVASTLDHHAIVVTDCYRTRVPAATTETNSGGTVTHRFAPCKDAIIEIRDSRLTVNSKGYGKLEPSDAVTVDHGKVLIGDREAQVVASIE